MPAFVNIELYQPMNEVNLKEINFLLESFIVKNKLEYTISESSKNKFNQQGINKITFKLYNDLTFRIFTRDLKLDQDWIVVELCIEYEKVLFSVNKQTNYIKGVKEDFVNIIKLLNKHFKSPAIIISTEIENGYFFEHYFGNGSKELAGFEMALIKNTTLNINTKEYKIIENFEEFNIYIQENEYVKWN